MPATDHQLIANKFYRWGWLGVWVQAVLAILPIVMLCVFLFGRAKGANVALGFMDYLALVGLAILAFTTFWSYRYTRLARRITDPAQSPDWTSVAKILRFGIWASCIGIVVSLFLLIVEVLRLLFLFLKTPQAGVPVIQTQAQSRAEWVSAMDVVSLLAEICTLVGELFVVGMSLWLLFAVLKHVGVFGNLDEPANS